MNATVNVIGELLIATKVRTTSAEKVNKYENCQLTNTPDLRVSR